MRRRVGLFQVGEEQAQKEYCLAATADILFLANVANYDEDFTLFPILFAMTLERMLSGEDISFQPSETGGLQYTLRLDDINRERLFSMHLITQWNWEENTIQFWFEPCTHKLRSKVVDAFSSGEDAPQKPEKKEASH